MGKKFTWAPIMPLIGGFPVGAEQAFKTAPEAVFSYDNIGNDQQYMFYQAEKKGRTLEYITLAEDDVKFERKINVIVGTPACAGLSLLNTGSSAAAKGVDAEKNKYMYMIFEHGMKKFDADVVVIENAPALATTRGEPVAQRLYDIAAENGYSMTLYKTSTHLHGIPQRRDRTFAIAWKSESAPIMDWENAPRKTFEEYLKEIPEDASRYDEVINEKLLECAYWQFIKETIGEPRKELISQGKKTCFNYINDNGLLDTAADWIKENGTAQALKIVEHAKKKFAQGKGIWDGSVHIFDEYMNAVIGRNMVDTIHPTEDRSLTIREAMHMMGLPHDFDLQGGRSNINMIAQNVPTCTAEFISKQIKKFINRELEFFNSPYVKQDNWKQEVEFRIPERHATLDEFFY